MTPAIWGILNVTPDSFSDGGLYLQPQDAVIRARQLIADGASVIDVGAESTRPGAERVSADEERRRLRPVVEALVAEDITVSVDTMRAEIAADMVERGATIINDISGGLADPDMLNTVAGLEADYVVMHWRGHSAGMEKQALYDDVVGQVCAELRERIEHAIDASIPPHRLTIDPGFGFAKDARHNWQLMKGLDEVVDLGFPVVVGASRKRFLGAVLDGDHEASERDGVSAVASVLAADKGVAAVRVHEPRIHREALAAWQAAREGSLS